MGYPPMPPAKPKGRVPLAVKILLPIVVVIALIVGGVVIFANHVVSNVADQDYYTLGGDQIPSVKLALGQQRKVISFENTTASGVTTQLIRYQVDGNQQNQDMWTYAGYLHDNDNFLTLTDFDFSGPVGSGALGRNSADAGQQLVVTLTYDTTGYAVTIVKQVGSVTPNTPDITDAPTVSPDVPTTNDTTDNPFAAEPSVTPADGWARDDAYSFPAWTKGDAQFLIVVADVSDIGMSHQDYTQRFRDIMEGESYTDEVSSVSRMPIGGFDAWQFSYLDNNDGTRDWSIYVFNDPVMYDIEASAPSADFDALVPEMTQMLNSFVVIPPK